MPIKPENKSLYPADWKEISKRIRFVRAANRCEWCGAQNGQPHPVTASKVVLTVAHLDHDPTHNDDANLAALCQKCHLSYDSAHHRKTAAETRRKAMGTGELFPEV
jgi:hypothetical protein